MDNQQQDANQVSNRVSNRIFIATSLDGYIADKDGGIDYLHSIPNPGQDDMGYADFMAVTDALVMGRGTFETVCGFDIDWPYEKPVFVLSSTLSSLPAELEDRVFLMNGPLNEVLDEIHQRGYHNLYIDGGKTIQSFLKEDLIDEMVITTIPCLLGGGTPLFGPLDHQLMFRCVATKIYLNAIVQSRFVKGLSEK